MKMQMISSLLFTNSAPFWIWANTVAAQWKWRSREGITHVSCITSCTLWHVYVRACGGESASCLLCMTVSVLVCQNADRVLKNRLRSCCSPQRPWLASLSRTETSASICVSAPWPYCWAAMSFDKCALCRSAPPVEVSRAREKTCKGFWAPPETRLWKSLLLRHLGQ